MKRIYKYEIPYRLAAFSIEMPRGAQWLTAKTQGELGPRLWAIVDPEQPTEMVDFRLVATDARIEENDLGEYIASLEIGICMHHLFRAAERTP